MTEEVKEGQEAPAAAEKPAEIDYKAEYTKQQDELKKFAGVDLDKWNRAKEFDFDRAESAIKAQEAREQEEREAQEAKDKEEAEHDPVTGLKKEIDSIKQSLTQREQAEKSKVQADWMERFDKSITGSIEQALKSEEFKDLEELTPTEKKYVVAMTNQAYEQDSQQKAPKLNLNTVGKVVTELVKEVKENRTALMSRKIKGQTHPTTPSSQDGATPAGHQKTDAERIEAMVQFHNGG